MAAEKTGGKAVRKHAAFFVFVTVLIDAMGIGIIIPVMPDLLRELSDLPLAEAAVWGGVLSFVYALMQFAFGPTIGNLSDRFGRRPVLLISLAALAVDYVVMALAPTLWLLFIGRVVAGIAGATHSTANAYIADVSPPEKRAQNFGLIGAGFGLGFVIGPIIGGVVGEFGTRVPFFAAAALAFLNFLYGCLVLPESLAKENRRPFNWLRANPLGAAAQIKQFPTLVWLFLTVFLFSIAHFVYPAIWAFYAKEAHDWSNTEIGISLAVVGVGFALVQGWLIRPILARLGEAKTAVLGFLVSIVGLVALAFVQEGWMVYALLPIVALGAIVTPALTALMTNMIGNDVQGELQGALTSVSAVTLVISPLLMTQLFSLFTRADTPAYFPGAPFLAAALLMGLALAAFRFGLRRARAS